MKSAILKYELAGKRFFEFGMQAFYEYFADVNYLLVLLFLYKII